MILRYCDACGREIAKTVTSTRLKGDGYKHSKGCRIRILFEVTCGVNGAWNAGDLCQYCVIDAILGKYDDRVRDASSGELIP